MALFALEHMPGNPGVPVPASWACTGLFPDSSSQESLLCECSEAQGELFAGSVDGAWKNRLGQPQACA